MASAIVVDGLVKDYSGRRAVDGIGFEVAPGETVAILGPNGAGKTTTVEILEGYRARDGGRIEVLGLDPADRTADLQQRIGIVLQECEAEPHHTATEIVEQFRAYYPDPRTTEDVLAVVGLTDAAGVRIKRLSGGQRRRLDLALALVGRPELLFLDEPTTGFDPAARHLAWDVIASLRGDGTTIVLTTHYLDEAEVLADRLLVLAGGRIVAEGTPSTIGGRDTTTRIAFDAAEPPAGCPLPLNTDGRRCWADVPDPVAALHALTGWAQADGHDLAGLEVGRRRLDEIYLELIA